MSEEKYKGQTKRIWYQKGVRDERMRLRSKIKKYKNSKDWYVEFGDEHEASAYTGALNDILQLLDEK